MHFFKTILLPICTLAVVSCANQGNNAANAANTDTALNIAAPSDSQLDVTPLSGYFVKNTIQVTDSLTFWVINNQASFDSLFGMAQTMNTVIDKPDFGTQLVVAATMPPTYYNTQIQLASATSDDLDNDAIMHFVAVANPDKSSAAIVPLWLGAVPKAGQRAFKLYTGDQLTQTITIQQ
ncbi:hypothetical protein ACDQ55_04375 [Chitinophaga sp. 30R24]|uniref:hypothetical protein n=1 Tax=Chitinophaga sp. 30R24 TaxID=3248838 RepID=UPI003B9204EE